MLGRIPENVHEALKFSEDLIPRVLNGEKTSTWRVNDDKGIVVGDKLSLCHVDGREFAQALVTYAKETTFGILTPEDRSGHEKYSSDAEMYKKFEQYYGIPITKDTKLKIIKFKLLR